MTRCEILEKDCLSVLETQLKKPISRFFAVVVISTQNVNSLFTGVTKVRQKAKSTAQLKIVLHNFEK